VVEAGARGGRVRLGCAALRVLVVLTLSASALGAERPDRWAAPLTVSGAPNLHKVSEVLYRSAQPSAAGMKRIESLGVKTVLNLRGFHSDTAEAKGTNLQLVHVRFDTWDVDEDELVAVLRVLRNPSKQPVLVHCKHGADRTGMIIALHRILFEGWTKAEAIEEMKNGGYGWHSMWTNIPHYLEKVDVEALRKKIEN